MTPRFFALSLLAVSTSVLCVGSLRHVDLQSSYLSTSRPLGHFLVRYQYKQTSTVWFAIAFFAQYIYIYHSLPTRFLTAESWFSLPFSMPAIQLTRYVCRRCWSSLMYTMTHLTRSHHILCSMKAMTLATVLSHHVTFLYRFVTQHFFSPSPWQNLS